MTTVVTPARLHFGLLNLPREGMTHWPAVADATALPMRQFGGVGLMIDGPRVRVRVEPRNEWTAAGVLAPRAIEFARTLMATLPSELQTCFSIQVEECPAEHTGLGVGTSLALAVAKALAVEMGFADWDATELARRVQRGARSAIGVHGFQQGGLLVEAGKLPGEMLSPLIGRYPFPAEWEVLLLRPQVEVGISGAAERAAFQRLRHSMECPGETLCRIVLTGLLPALISHDYRGFCDSLYEFNHRVGLWFSPAQAGAYASPQVVELVATLRSAGIHGVGQSSWGPTVFAILNDPTQFESLIRKLPSSVVVERTTAAIQGAQVLESGGWRNQRK